MKKVFFFLLALLAFTTTQAQILDPVAWTTKIEKLSENEFNLVFEAKIEPDWHVYSQFTPDGGPLPLEFAFKNAGKDYSLAGKATESKTSRAYNDTFEVDEVFFSNTATLKQKIKVLNVNVTTIDVTLEYQVCKEVCINQKKKFTFKLPKITIPTSQDVPAPGVIGGSVVTDSIASQEIVGSENDTISNKESDNIIEKAIDAPNQAPPVRNLWAIFFIAFLSGFAALLTPCVFPLIPMTVSFFTKQSKTKAMGIRNAITYGISIIVIYVTLGFLVSWIFGADALNSLATNVYFNVIFFLLLVTFAASFLGAFEIMLPNSWANKVDRQADRGGIVGILFMALALAIVSFSCTGPIVGTLLFEAASNGVIGPIVGMFGFSLALALPFMLFAMFPGWLNSLPKSGGWLNTVKVFLGFLELALAFKFLSNADLVLQLHFLEREVFLAIWIAIFGTMALYLFGKIQLPHDGPPSSISVGRLMLGLLVLTFTVYLIPGLWGAPLKLISAFPPPMEYSESPRGFGASSGGETRSALPDGAKYGPHDIVSFTDYETGLAYAKSVNKPAIIDFTGWACVNCRKMENNVWSDPRVLSILKNDVVLLSLYVDDRRPLPESEHYTAADGDLVETIGEKWTDFMITNYKTNTQPLYVLTDTEGKELQGTMSYTDTETYLKWLRAGVEKFNKK